MSPQDDRELRELNEKIGDAESRGDREWLSTIIAPRLSFQRADKDRTVDDQVAFLQKVKEGPPRSTRIVEPIEVYGNRAIVRCVVTLDKERFHNLRLLVRRDGQWKLLGWANEPL